jgi:protein-S-isoprenylcysteine O-methyltransferase Ste14
VILGVVSPFALVMAVAALALVFFVWLRRHEPDVRAASGRYVARALLLLGVGVAAQLLAMR